MLSTSSTTRGSLQAGQRTGCSLLLPACQGRLPGSTGKFPPSWADRCFFHLCQCPKLTAATMSPTTDAPWVRVTTPPAMSTRPMTKTIAGKYLRIVPFTRITLEVPFSGRAAPKTKLENSCDTLRDSLHSWAAQVHDHPTIYSIGRIFNLVNTLGKGFENCQAGFGGRPDRPVHWVRWASLGRSRRAVARAAVPARRPDGPLRSEEYSPVIPSAGSSAAAGPARGLPPNRAWTLSRNRCRRLHASRGSRPPTCRQLPYRKDPCGRTGRRPQPRVATARDDPSRSPPSRCPSPCAGT
jgi:hypothetical protein